MCVNYQRPLSGDQISTQLSESPGLKPSGPQELNASPLKSQGLGEQRPIPYPPTNPMEQSAVRGPDPFYLTCYRKQTQPLRRTSRSLGPAHQIIPKEDRHSSNFVSTSDHQATTASSHRTDNQQLPANQSTTARKPTPAMATLKGLV